MFTQGQIYFAIFFIVAFTGVLIAAYLTDRKVQKKHYRGVLFILLAVLIFLALFILTKRYLLGV
jgi:sugar phosphate permease